MCKRKKQTSGRPTTRAQNKKTNGSKKPKRYSEKIRESRRYIVWRKYSGHARAAENCPVFRIALSARPFLLFAFGRKHSVIIHAAPDSAIDTEAVSFFLVVFSISFARPCVHATSSSQSANDFRCRALFEFASIKSLLFLVSRIVPKSANLSIVPVFETYAARDIIIIIVTHEETLFSVRRRPNCVVAQRVRVSGTFGLFANFSFGLQPKLLARPIDRLCGNLTRRTGAAIIPTRRSPVNNNGSRNCTPLPPPPPPTTSFFLDNDVRPSLVGRSSTKRSSADS